MIMKRNISNNRQKALAKERLEALRRKKQQRSTQENLEQKLKEENETNKLLDAEESSGKEIQGDLNSPLEDIRPK
jgi:membrane protein involved in colicin uptake